MTRIWREAGARRQASRLLDGVPDALLATLQGNTRRAGESLSKQSLSSSLSPASSLISFASTARSAGGPCSPISALPLCPPAKHYVYLFPLPLSQLLSVFRSRSSAPPSIYHFTQMVCRLLSNLQFFPS